MTEILFTVIEAPEGGLTARAVGFSIFTEADTLDEVSANVTDALEALIEGYEELHQPLPEVLRPIGNNAPFMTETLVHLEAA